MSFDEHMQTVNGTWTKYLNSTLQRSHIIDPTVVFTTESVAMVNDQANFASNSTWQAKYPYRFHFVTNDRDVHPDSGFQRDIHRNFHRTNITADDIMLSTVSSFQAQLYPAVTIGNCCSNFHVLMSDFLMEGCGAAIKSNHKFVCLQEYEDDPLLRVCCGWHKKCIANRKKLLAEAAGVA